MVVGRRSLREAGVRGTTSGGDQRGRADRPSVQDLTPKQRFWQKVIYEESCWLWRGARRGDGYGAFQVGYRQIAAHRYSYELHHGAIPEDMVVMHVCDVPLCVNPEHLRLGTQADNQRDSALKGRRHPGSQNHQSKLTEEQVTEMRERYAAGGVTQKELAIDYGVSGGLVKSHHHAQGLEARLSVATMMDALATQLQEELCSLGTASPVIEHLQVENRLHPNPPPRPSTSTRPPRSPRSWLTGHGTSTGSP